LAKKLSELTDDPAQAKASREIERIAERTHTHNNSGPVHKLNRLRDEGHVFRKV